MGKKRNKDKINLNIFENEWHPERPAIKAEVHEQLQEQIIQELADMIVEYAELSKITIKNIHEAVAIAEEYMWNHATL